MSPKSALAATPPRVVSLYPHPAEDGQRNPWSWWVKLPIEAKAHGLGMRWPELVRFVGEA